MYVSHYFSLSVGPFDSDGYPNIDAPCVRRLDGLSLHGESDSAPSTASCQVFRTTGGSQSVGAKEQDYHRQTPLDKWGFLTLMNDWIIYLGIPPEWGPAQMLRRSHG